MNRLYIYSADLGTLHFFLTVKKKKATRDFTLEIYRKVSIPKQLFLTSFPECLDLDTLYLMFAPGLWNPHCEPAQLVVNKSPFFTALVDNFSVLTLYPP
jgi:hypothetical protein